MESKGKNNQLLYVFIISHELINKTCDNIKGLWKNISIRKGFKRGENI